MWTLLPLALISAVVVAGPASAVDDAKPAYTCGMYLKDSDKDAAEPNAAGDPHHDNMEIVGAFFKHEPAKAAEATTVNVIIKDLTTDLPEGNTAINWSVEWTVNDKIQFVRAVADYSGSTAFEYGEFTATGTPGLSGTYRYVGPTQGKLFEGPLGVVQLVIPADIGGKIGTQIKGITIKANTGKSAVPVAAPTPSRGVAYTNDDIASSGWTVAECVAGAAPGPVVEVPPGPSGPAASGTSGPTALPVFLRTTKVAAKKAKKQLKLSLSSTEPVTKLVAQLRKGSKMLAKGKLAKLSGKGTLKLKVKKLKKGRYLLDMTGRDASGASRSTTAKLTIK